jgi:DNA polymerase III sliding clamp (beta) subunit (PCNA family)
MPPHLFLVETDNGDGQTAKEKVAYKPDAFAGMPLAIGVSLKYLIEALNSFTSKNVWLGFNGDLDPIGVRESATDADIIVLMPMRV